MSEKKDPKLSGSKVNRYSTLFWIWLFLNLALPFFVVNNLRRKGGEGTLDGLLFFTLPIFSGVPFALSLWLLSIGLKNIEQGNEKIGKIQKLLGITITFGIAFLFMVFI